MQSWELLSELLFISFRASLKNISEGARETPAASDPACRPAKAAPGPAGGDGWQHLQGWDCLWGPQRRRCHGRESSRAVCGHPQVKWVSLGTGDASREPFGACLAEAVFTWQPPSYAPCMGPHT